MTQPGLMLTEAQHQIIDRCARRAATAQEGNELRWIIYWLTMRVERAEKQSQDCECAYHETARLQLADVLDEVRKANKHIVRSLAAWRLYMDMAQDASDAHQEPLA